jgi:hypothetical protein
MDKTKDRTMRDHYEMWTKLIGTVFFIFGLIALLYLTLGGLSMALIPRPEPAYSNGFEGQMIKSMSEALAPYIAYVIGVIFLHGIAAIAFGLYLMCSKNNVLVRLCYPDSAPSACTAPNRHDNDDRDKFGDQRTDDMKRYAPPGSRD